MPQQWNRTSVRIRSIKGSLSLSNVKSMTVLMETPLQSPPYFPLDFEPKMMEPTKKVVAKEILSHCQRIIRYDSEHVDVFKPHHVVEIRYPSLGLLEDGETLMIPRALHSSARYNPSDPLIPDRSVTKHAGRRSADETTFMSYYTTTPQNSAFFRANRRRFFDDMDDIILHSGRSQIRACIYARVGEEDDPTLWRCRLRRTTDFYDHALFHPGARVNREQIDYVLDDILKVARDGFKRPWFTQLVDLFLRKSDQAALHVRLRYKQAADFRAMHIEIPEVHWLGEYRRWLERDTPLWKKKREIDYGPYVDGLVKTVNVSHLSEDERTCLICAEIMGTPGHTAVALPCNPDHIVCRACITQSCEAEGPENARCPFDRVRFFDDDQVDQLKYNLTDGMFFNDPRFSDWENFQRSCADLDKRLIQDNVRENISFANPIPMVFFHAWLHLCEQDAIHSEEVTVPEFRRLMLIMERHLRMWEGQVFNFRQAYDMFQVVIYDALKTQMVEGPWRNVWTPLIWEGWGKRQLPLRRGYKYFIDRSIERAIKFVELRECLCESGSSTPMHDHGGRRYYNSQAFIDWLENSPPVSSKEFLREPLHEWLEKKEEKYRKELAAQKPKARGIGGALAGAAFTLVGDSDMRKLVAGAVDKKARFKRRSPSRDKVVSGRVKRNRRP